MSTKASTVVVIDKKEYNLSGFEQEDYLQMVAAYINQKITEMNQQESYKRIPQDMKNLMLQLNLADDYFKAKEQAEISGGKFSDLEKEIFELKHKLVEVQMKADDNASKVELLKAQNSDFQTQIEKLEKEKRELLAGKQQLQATLEDALLGSTSEAAKASADEKKTEKPQNKNAKNSNPQKINASFDKYKVR